MTAHPHQIHLEGACAVYSVRLEEKEAFRVLPLLIQAIRRE